ncbi:MAG: hypothetical protein LBU44_00260 [Mediterranea sp.]|jgi:hypothetical protein|nr:hypothetical protein [Mediterranea sp.]
MARKSLLFGSLIYSAAKAADKAIKQAAKEREWRAKAAAKECERKAKAIQAFTIEYSSHERILNDSMKLIETTNDIDTLLGRYKDASEEWSWMEMQKAKGMPIIINQESCGFYSTLNRVTNFHIIRIANFNYAKLQNDVVKLKSKMAVENRVTKLLVLLDKCISSLKYHDNLEKSQAELTTIHSKVRNLINK